MGTTFNQDIVHGLIGIHSREVLLYTVLYLPMYHEYSQDSTMIGITTV